jgi:dolichol-phosphate hexosyltransferase
MSVAIIIPTYNEEEGIGQVIDRAVRVKKPDWTIYVLDSCSTDKTVEIAKRQGATVAHLPMRGKGLAIKKLFSEIDSDYVVTLDGDNTYPPEEIHKVLSALEKYDAVVGSRFRGKMENGAMSLLNNVGNRFLSISASAMYLHPISDICTGMWGFRKSFYKSMDITASHLDIEPNYFTECVKKKARLGEVGINYGTRLGTTKVTFSVLFGVKDFLFLLRNRF